MLLSISQMLLCHALMSSKGHFELHIFLSGNGTKAASKAASQSNLSNGFDKQTIS